MMGEELNAADVTQRGLLGDHAYALVDGSDGKVASAKNPRKWPNLFDFRTTFIEPPRISAKMTPVRITLPDGTIISSERNDLNQILLKALSRDVTLDTIERGHEEAVESSLPKPLTANAEEYWPDMEELDYRDAVTDFALPEGTFFDCAVVHLLTMATRTGSASSIRRGASRFGGFVQTLWWNQAPERRTLLKMTGSVTCST
jgi:hypothetical protein